MHPQAIDPSFTHDPAGHNGWHHLRLYRSLVHFQEVHGVYALVEPLLLLFSPLLLLLLLFLRRWPFFLLRWWFYKLRRFFFLGTEITWIRWIDAMARFHHLRDVALLVAVPAVETREHLRLVRGCLVFCVVAVWEKQVLHVLRRRLMWNAKWTLLRLSVVPSMIESRYRFHLCWKMLMIGLRNLRAPGKPNSRVIDIVYV